MAVIDFEGKSLSKRNILQEYCNAKSFVGVGIATFLLVSWLRYRVLEAGQLPLDCSLTPSLEAGGACLAKWLLLEVFLHQRLGAASLVLGAAAFVLHRRGLAWGGWLTGIAGLVLYNFDYAAVGVMLSLLVLVAPAQQERRGEEQRRDEPRDGLQIGGLH